MKKNDNMKILHFAVPLATEHWQSPLQAKQIVNKNIMIEVANDINI